VIFKTSHKNSPCICIAVVANFTKHTNCCHCLCYFPREKKKPKIDNVLEETSHSDESATEDASPVKVVVKRKGARQIIDSDDSEDEGVAMETSNSDEVAAMETSKPAVTVSISQWTHFCLFFGGPFSLIVSVLQPSCRNH